MLSPFLQISFDAPVAGLRVGLLATGGAFERGTSRAACNVSAATRARLRPLARGGSAVVVVVVVVVAVAVGGVVAEMAVLSR